MTAAADWGDVSSTRNALPVVVLGHVAALEQADAQNAFRNQASTHELFRRKPGDCIRRRAPTLQALLHGGDVGGQRGCAIRIASGGDLYVVIPFCEGAPERHDLSPHADLLDGMAGVEVGAENPVGGVSINHFRDVDIKRILAGFARYSLHLGESVSQVAFCGAVHVFVKVVGIKVT